MATGASQCRTMRVLAIGNTIIDTVLTMPAIPIDDKVWITSKNRYVGGQGANAAQGMSRLGLSVSFLTRIGDDDDGAMAHKRFKEMDLDTSHVIVVPGVQTMSACVTIGMSDQTRSCLMHRDEAMFGYDVKAHLDKVNLDNYDAVYTDGHQMDLTLPIAAAAAARGLPVLADVEVLNDDTRALAELATELIAPWKMIEELAGASDPGTAALILADRPGRTVIATAGALGSYGAEHGCHAAVHVEADSNCQAIDTVGAGDAYHAGYLAAVARRVGGLKDCMTFATKVAAALCETPGPVVSHEALVRFGIFPWSAGQRLPKRTK